jgi:hypothetical protein
VALEGLILSLGWGYAEPHGDGVWRQKFFPYTMRTDGPTWGIGYRVGGWEFGYRDLIHTSSSAQGVEDADYDVGTGQCKHNCDSPATYVTSGRVYGLYGEYRWRAAGWELIAGLLAFIPEHEVVVSDWDETGEIQPPHTYVNPRELRVSPYVGASYQFAPHTAVVARYYTSIRGAGDDGFKSRTTLYGGPVITMSLEFTF